METMKASAVVAELQQLIAKHGDLDVAVIVDDNIKSEETQIDDVSLAIFQQEKRCFIGLVGTIYEEEADEDETKPTD